MQLCKQLMIDCRMHLAIKAYGELLSSLMAMDESNDEQVKESAKVIKGMVK